LLIIDFGLAVQPYHPRDQSFDGFQDGTALTEDENVINPHFSPNENINRDHKREKHWDE
jgi:hypothetical protein